jgi:hypothetical protein
VVQCTFTRNACHGFDQATGGAVQLSGGTLINCIFWSDSIESEAGAAFDKEICGPVSVIRNCVVEGGFAGSPGPIITANPLLGAFGRNGGPVSTISIDPAGSARNAGTSAVPAGIDISKDARGYPRADGLPDIGAFEVQ